MNVRSLISATCTIALEEVQVSIWKEIEQVNASSDRLQKAPPLTLEKSMETWEDAQIVSPGGMPPTRRPLMGNYPIFFDRGYAGHVIDVDGNDYIDLMGAWGPIVLSYADTEVNEAVKQRIDKGFCFSCVNRLQNELNHKLIDLIPSAEQVLIVKTGSDATSMAVRGARAYTGRDKIIHRGYHGWHDWCVEIPGGVPQQVQDLTIALHRPFDLNELETALEENANQVAAVMITPIDHEGAKPVLLPPEGYLEAAKQLAHKHGAILIFDEIRTGFRVALGGAQEIYGVVPDLTTVGKAMANGYPIAALVGSREVLSVFASGLDAWGSSTYWNNNLEMVAALKTIEILERDNVPQVMTERCAGFDDRLRKIIEESGVSMGLSEVPMMPIFLFPRVDEHARDRRAAFFTEAIRCGLFMHPAHNGYFCYGHSQDDYDRILEIVQHSLAVVNEEYPETRS